MKEASGTGITVDDHNIDRNSSTVIHKYGFRVGLHRLFTTKSIYMYRTSAEIHLRLPVRKDALINISKMEYLFATWIISLAVPAHHSTIFNMAIGYTQTEVITVDALREFV